MFSIHEYQGADGTPLRYGKLVNKDQPDTGRALLFVPGLGGSVKGAIDFLEALLPFYSPIYGPDLRSFGLNPTEQPLQGTEILFQDLAAFHQQVIGPANHPELNLCGISLGGVIATRLAVQCPERYRRLALIAPAYRPHPKSFGLCYTLKNTLSFIFQGENARTQLPYGVEALTRNEEILNDPAYCETDPAVLAPGFLLRVRLLSMQAFNDTRRLRLPTMVVIPGQDIVCDPVAMRQGFHRIPATTPKLCKEYPDFYHDVLFETGHTEIAQELLVWSDSADSLATSSSSI